MVRDWGWEEVDNVTTQTNVQYVVVTTTRQSVIRCIAGEVLIKFN